MNIQYVFPKYVKGQRADGENALSGGRRDYPAVRKEKNKKRSQKESIYDDIFAGIDEALAIVDEAISTGNFDNMSERIREAVEPLDQKTSTGNRWRGKDKKTQ